MHQQTLGYPAKKQQLPRQIHLCMELGGGSGGFCWGWLGSLRQRHPPELWWVKIQPWARSSSSAKDPKSCPSSPDPAQGGWSHFKQGFKLRCLDLLSPWQRASCHSLGAQRLSPIQGRSLFPTKRAGAIPCWLWSLTGIFFLGGSRDGPQPRGDSWRRSAQPQVRSGRRGKSIPHPHGLLWDFEEGWENLMGLLRLFTPLPAPID